MESVETTQPEKGYVSAQGKNPKDEQNTFTQEEKNLAARFGVEPKLVRLLNAIVNEKLRGINECLTLINEKLDERLVAPEQTAAEPEQETQDQPEQEEESWPSTGVPFLDELIQRATYSEAAMAYTCLRASRIDKELIDKLSAALKFDFDELQEKHRKDDRSLDLECEVLPALKWIIFLKGFEAGSSSFGTELRDPGEKAIEEEITTEESQPKEETTTGESQTEELEEADSEDAEPEKESYGFDPKKRVRAYEAFEQWLGNRTLDEKRAALALSMLLGKQQYLPDEHIGDRLYKQWRDEVLSVSNLDQLQLKGVPGNEAFCQGYLTAMIIMDG